MLPGCKERGSGSCVSWRVSARDADAVFEEAIAALKAAGAEVVDPVTIPSNSQIRMGRRYPAGAGMGTEGRAGRVFRRVPASGFAQSPRLADVIAFNDANAAEEMP